MWTSHSLGAPKQACQEWNFKNKTKNNNKKPKKNPSKQKLKQETPQNSHQNKQQTTQRKPPSTFKQGYSPGQAVLHHVLTLQIPLTGIAYNFKCKHLKWFLFMCFM